MEINVCYKKVKNKHINKNEHFKEPTGTSNYSNIVVQYEHSFKWYSITIFTWEIETSISNINIDFPMIINSN